MSEVRNLDAIGFKYKIGDRLMHVGHTAMAFPAEPGSVAPACFVVGERIAQECPGGVQLKYGGTWASADGHVTNNQWALLESDLVPYAPAIAVCYTKEEATALLAKFLEEKRSKAKE